MDQVNKLILEKENVFVYRIPPQIIKNPKLFNRATNWDLSYPIKICKLTLAAVGPSCHIQLDDNSGNIFGQSDIHWFPGGNGRSSALNAVLDSSRYFTLEVKNNCGVCDFLGLGFSSHDDSSGLTKTLEDYFLSLHQIQEKVAITPVIKIEQKFVPAQITTEIDSISEGEEDTTHSVSIKREQDNFLEDDLEFEPISPVSQEGQLEQELDSQVLIPEGTEPISDDEDKDIAVEKRESHGEDKDVPVEINESIDVDKDISVEISESNDVDKDVAVKISEPTEVIKKKKPIKKQKLKKLLAKQNFIGDDGLIEFKFHMRRLVRKHQAKRLKRINRRQPGDTSSSGFRYREGRTFKCHLCPNYFFRVSSKSKSVLPLENHWKKVHGIEVADLINCSKCSIVFSSEDQFSSHKKLVHYLEFRCFLCPKKFVHKVKLRRHLLKFHIPALLRLVPKGSQNLTEIESIPNNTQSSDLVQHTTHMDCNVEVISGCEDDQQPKEELPEAIEAITAEDEDENNNEEDNTEIITLKKRGRKRKRKIEKLAKTSVPKLSVVVDKEDYEKLRTIARKLIDTYRKKMFEWMEPSQLEDTSCGGIEYCLPGDMLQCHLCPASFRRPHTGSKLALTIHWEEVHVHTIILRCVMCNLAFLTKTQFTRHKELAHDFDCFLCSAIFGRFENLSRHLLRDHISLLSELEAEQKVATGADIDTEAIEKSYEDIVDGDLEIHEEKANSDGTDLLKRIIELNDERINTNNILIRNQSASEHPEGEPVLKVPKLSENQCPKEENGNTEGSRFLERSKHYLNSMMRNDKFKMVRKLKAEETIVGDLEAKAVDPESELDDGKFIHCKVEDQMLSTLPILEVTERNFTDAHAQSFDCEAYLEEIACGGSYYHFADNSLQCHLCPVNFFPSSRSGSDTKLKIHWEKFHEIDKILVCRACRIVFSNEDQVAEHKKLIHDFDCYLCSLLLYSEGALRRHLRFKHNHSLKFSCEVCPKTFGILRTILEHKEAFGH